MFKHLLVPLDGSPPAEVAIRRAAGLARVSGGTVTLLHVLERDAPQAVHGERHLRGPDEAGAYIEETLGRFADVPRLKGHVHAVEVDDVVGGIVSHVAELGADTIVMSQHGRGGLRAWRLGRLPQQIAARGRTPVLLVRSCPQTASARESACGRVLIPHDDDPAHAPALELGAELARLCGATVRLVRVVPTRRALGGAAAATAGMLPAMTQSLLELEARAAEEHLRRHADELMKTGLSVEIDVVRGDPLRRLAQVSKHWKADVLVLGTHALAGTRAFWEGSVGARLCTRVGASVLLVPVTTG